MGNGFSFLKLDFLTKKNKTPFYLYVNNTKWGQKPYITTALDSQ